MYGQYVCQTLSMLFSVFISGHGCVILRFSTKSSIHETSESLTMAVHISIELFWKANKSEISPFKILNYSALQRLMQAWNT